MARTDELADFVRAGLVAGRAPSELGHALISVGWSEREVATALGAWMPGDAGIPPVPRPRPYVSAGQVVIYGLLFLMLAAICWTVSQIGFDVIDLLLVRIDPPYPILESSLRWPVAVLIVMGPLFLWLNARVGRSTRGDPGQSRSLVRKWLAAATLLIAAIALLTDAVVVINAFLSGDMTLNFLAKAALVALIGLLTLAYYRDELDARDVGLASGKAAVGRARGWATWGFAVLIATAIGAGLAISGGPGVARQETRDETRGGDLSALSTQIQCLAAEQGAFPTRIEPTDRCPAVPRKEDPFTGEPYRIEPLDAAAYRLCAGFERPPVRYADNGRVNGCIVYQLPPKETASPTPSLTPAPAASPSPPVGGDAPSGVTDPVPAPSN